MDVRAFISVGIPTELKDAVGKITSSLSSQISGVRWVIPENLHITLKFLDDIEENIIPNIQVALNHVVKKHLPITCQFGGLGVFPNLRRPRIIWLGVEKGGDQLSGLAADLDKELSGSGFKPEKRKFTPHLTLGRIKKGARTARLIKLLGPDGKKIDLSDHSTGLLNINMLLLQKSTLTSNGAIHQILSEHYINGRV